MLGLACFTTELGRSGFFCEEKGWAQWDLKKNKKQKQKQKFKINNWKLERRISGK